MILIRYVVARSFAPFLSIRRFWGFLCCFALFACSSSYEVSGEDSAKRDPKTFEQRTTVEIQSKGNDFEFAGSYKTIARFDALPAARSGVLRVGIRNTEDFDLPIGKIKVSCGCTKATLMGNVLRAGETTDLVVELKSPKRHGSGLFSSVVTLEFDENTVPHKRLTHVTVLLSIKLTGLLCFKDQMVTARVSPDRAGKLNLPFINTLNVPKESLIVDATDDLLGVEGEIMSDGEMSYVSLSIDPKTFGTKRAFGTISISDPNKEISDLVRIVLEPEIAAEINPSQLQFRMSSNADADTEPSFTANAILRLGASSPDDVKPKALVVEATINGVPINVDVKTLNKSVHRLMFACTKNTLDRLMSEHDPTRMLRETMKWRVITSKNTYTGDTTVVFSIQNPLIKK